MGVGYQSIDFFEHFQLFLPCLGIVSCLDECHHQQNKAADEHQGQRNGQQEHTPSHLFIETVDEQVVFVVDLLKVLQFFGIQTAHFLVEVFAPNVGFLHHVVGIEDLKRNHSHSYSHGVLVGSKNLQFQLRFLLTYEGPNHPFELSQFLGVKKVFVVGVLNTLFYQELEVELELNRRLVAQTVSGRVVQEFREELEESPLTHVLVDVITK